MDQLNKPRSNSCLGGGHGRRAAALTIVMTSHAAETFSLHGSHTRPKAPPARIFGEWAGRAVTAAPLEG